MRMWHRNRVWKSNCVNFHCENKKVSDVIIKCITFHCKEMHCEIPLSLFLLAIVITLRCKCDLIYLQVEAYDDSLWKVNINDATLECTLVNFFANWSKIRKCSFCIVNFDVEFEQHIFRVPTIIPFLTANRFSSKNSTNMMTGGSVLVICYCRRLFLCC